MSVVDKPKVDLVEKAKGKPCHGGAQPVTAPEGAPAPWGWAVCRKRMGYGSRSTGYGVRTPRSQSWLLTYSVTLQVSEFSVAWFPFLKNEANHWVVMRTKEINLCGVLSTVPNTEDK